jgi:hypothetical protein
MSNATAVSITRPLSSHFGPLIRASEPTPKRFDVRERWRKTRGHLPCFVPAPVDFLRSDRMRAGWLDGYEIKVTVASGPILVGREQMDNLPGPVKCDLALNDPVGRDFHPLLDGVVEHRGIWARQTDVARFRWLL